MVRKNRFPWTFCRRLVRLVLVVTLSLPASALAMPLSVADFVAHKATYDLFLDRERRGDGVSSARGRMEFEWANVCDGWSITQKTRIFVGKSEGYNMDFGWSLSTWEAKDGLEYRFFLRRFTDGQESEQLQGEAQLDSIGGAGRASFTQPEDKEVELPTGTLFPTWHSFALIDAARAGESMFWRLLFDGSGEDDGLSGVSAAIGGTLPPQREGLLDSPLIQERDSWRMGLAFFSLDETETLPAHEQELRLFATGVADDFVFDYGDFALRARLVKLEPLPAAGC